jgi:hypothetical protein
VSAEGSDEARSHLERARLLFAELRRSAPELVTSALEKLDAGHWRAALRAPGPFFGDYEQAHHETDAGAVAVLAGTVKAMAQKRHADLGKALDAYDADPKATPRRAGRGRR